MKIVWQRMASCVIIIKWEKAKNGEDKEGAESYKK